MTEPKILSTGSGPGTRFKTHCVHGHPLSGDNLIQTKRNRMCKTCMAERQMRLRHNEIKARTRCMYGHILSAPVYGCLSCSQLNFYKERLAEGEPMESLIRKKSSSSSNKRAQTQTWIIPEPC